MVEVARKSPTPYVTRRTFADPTAVEAVKNVFAQQWGKAETDSKPLTDTQLLTYIQGELTLLNQRRTNKEITKKEFGRLREPLRICYQELIERMANSREN